MVMHLFLYKSSKLQLILISVKLSLLVIMIIGKKRDIRLQQRVSRSLYSLPGQSERNPEGVAFRLFIFDGP